MSEVGEVSAARREVGNECGMAAGVVPRLGSEPPHTPVEVAAFLAEIDREAVDDRNFVLTGAQSQAGSEGFVAVGDVQTAQGAAEKQRDRATRGVVHAAK